MTRAPLSARLCWGSQPLSLFTEKFPDREADSPVVSADGKTCLGRSPLVTGLASRELRGKGQSSWAARVAPLPTVAALTVQGHSSVRAQRSQTQHRPLPVQCGGWTAGLAWASLLWRTDTLCLSELNDCMEVCSLRPCERYQIFRGFVLLFCRMEILMSWSSGIDTLVSKMMCVSFADSVQIY